MSMTEPNFSIDNATELEAAAEPAAPDDTELHNHAVSHVATARPGTSSARTSFLDLPPEIRVIIYGYVLQLHGEIRIDNPNRWEQPQLHAWTALLFTSRLIQRQHLPLLSREDTFFSDPRFSRLSAVPSWRITNMIAIIFTSQLIFRESVPVLLRQNTFSFGPRFSRRSVVPSPQITDMMQNFSVTIAVPTPAAHPRLRARFAESIRIVEDPAIIRGTFNVCFDLHGFRIADITLLEFFLDLMRGLTNFRIVKVAFRYRVRPGRFTAAMHGDLVQNALRSVLGPSTGFGNPSSELLRGVMFHPQRFVNARSSRQYVNGNEGETNTDQNVDGFGPPA